VIRRPLRATLLPYTTLFRSPRLRAIRVVILTTSRAEDDIARSYGLSAASFITKPVTFETLVDVIATLGKYWLEIVHLPDEKEGRSEEHTSELQSRFDLVCRL